MGSGASGMCLTVIWDGVIQDAFKGHLGRVWGVILDGVRSHLGWVQVHLGCV
jgi:hypothetical protein